MESTYQPNSFASPVLKGLEQKRSNLAQQVKQYQILLFSSVGGLAFVFIASANDWLDAYPSVTPFLFGAAAIIGIIYAAYYWNKLDKQYLETVKIPALNSIIKDRKLDWAAYPPGYIDEHFLNATNLFKSSPDNVTCTPFLQGNYHNKWFTCTRAEYSKGHGKRKSTVFSGLILQVNIEYGWKGTTVVLPDMAQSLLGKTLGGKLQGLASHNGLKVVHFEDKAFEKEYVVYTHWEDEARSILDSTMIDSLKELGKTYSGEVHISFQSNQITVAIGGLSMFKFGVKNSITDATTIEGIEDDLTWVTRVLDCFV